MLKCYVHGKPISLPDYNVSLPRRPSENSLIQLLAIASRDMALHLMEFDV